MNAPASRFDDFLTWQKACTYLVQSFRGLFAALSQAATPAGVVFNIVISRGWRPIGPTPG
jgi:hypothetical protein